MKNFENLPELSKLIELIFEGGIEHASNIKRLHGSEHNLILSEKYLAERFPFNSFSKETRMKAAYYIVHQNNIDTNVLEGDFSDINDFIRKSFIYKYNNNIENEDC